MSTVRRLCPVPHHGRSASSDVRFYAEFFLEFDRLCLEAVPCADFHVRAAERLLSRLFVSCPLSLSPHQTLSAGVFELKIDSFTSSRSVCRSSSRDCQMFFRVCLKHSQDVINPEPPCTYGTALTDVFGADSNSFSDLAHIRVPFHFKWPVGAGRCAALAPPTDPRHVSMGHL